MKKNYAKPKMTVLEIQATEIIAQSGGTSGGTGGTGFDIPAEE